MHDFSNRGLIETAELAQLLESGTKVKIVDATYIMPGSPIDGRDLYEQRYRTCYRQRQHLKKPPANLA